MKITLYAIVPGETREEAIEHAHRAFHELIPTKSGAPDGLNPIFDYYRLHTDIPESNDGVYPTSKDEIKEEMDDIWENMVDKLQSFEDSEDGYAPEPCTPTRCREYIIYDAQARPVLSPMHYNNLIKQDDHWVVPALFSW
jgi:hypothetical protein